MKVYSCVDCGWKTRKHEITRRARWHQFMFEHHGFVEMDNMKRLG